MRVQARPPRSAHKVMSGCDQALQVPWGNQLVSAGSCRASRAHWLLFPVLPQQQLFLVHLCEFFTALTLLYCAIFNGFLLLICRPRILTIKRNSQGWGTLLGSFLSTHPSDQRSFQSTCHCNSSVTVISLLYHFVPHYFYLVAQHLRS